MNSFYLDAIRKLEGFVPRAQWDYAQYSNGYGTKALYAGEVIDRAEAERRFQTEIASARAIVEQHAAAIDEGTKAALTSLTFNAGDKWTRSGLGEAVRSVDLDAVRELFLQYNKAGGKELPGLVDRRSMEACWIGRPHAIDIGNEPWQARIADAAPLHRSAMNGAELADAHLAAARDPLPPADLSRSAFGDGVLGQVSRDADDTAARAAVSLLQRLLGDTLVDRTVLGPPRVDRAGNLRQDRSSGEEREDERRRREDRIESA